MATIRKKTSEITGKVSYHVQVRQSGFPTQTKTFARQADAEAWSRKIESEIERGKWKDTTKAEEKTIADVLRMYRDGRALDLRDCPPATKTAIKQAMADGIEPTETTPTRDRINVLLRRNPAWEKLGILNFGQADVTAYITKRQAEGVTNGTIGRELDMISTAINRARAGGLPIQLNPIETIDRPEVDNARDRRLQEGEMPALMSQLRLRKRNPDGTLGKNGVDNPYIKWIVRWCIETATRQGETLKLEWRHVQEKRRFIHLPAAICKNGTARDVPLSTRALRVLRVMKTLRPDNEPRIFPTTRHAVKKSWERACERCGIDDLHFHDLRHEATSRLADRFNVLELASITGHKDLQSLKRYYHPRAENLARKLA